MNCEKKFVHNGNSVNVVAFSPDALHFASGLSNGTVKIWNAKTEKCENTLNLKKLRGNNYQPISLTFGNNSKYLVIGTSTGNVLTWCVDTNKTEFYLYNNRYSQPIIATALSTNGKCLASRGYDSKQLLIFNIATKAAIVGLQNEPVVKRIEALHFVTDQKLLCFFDNGLLTTWERQSVLFCKTNETTLFSNKNGPFVGEVTFSSDASLLAYATIRNVVCVWNLNSMTAKEFPHKDAISAMQFVKNRYLVTCQIDMRAGRFVNGDETSSCSRISIINVKENAFIKEIEIPRLDKSWGDIYSLSISPSLKHFVVAGTKINLFTFLDYNLIAKLAATLLKLKTFQLVVLDVINFVCCANKCSFWLESEFFEMEKTVFISGLKKQLNFP